MTSAQGVSQAREPRTFQGSLDRPSEWCPWSPELPGAECSLQVATTVDAIEALRSTWSQWAHSLDTDIDYFLHNLTHDSGNPHPYVITVSSKGTAQAMLVGQIRKRKAFSVVSFVNIPGPQARVLEIKNDGRLGRPSAAIDKLLALELLRAARSGEVDSVCFERLPLHSELFRQIQKVPGLLVAQRVLHVFRYSVLALNTLEKKHPEVFWGKLGREIRRKSRIVQCQFTDQVRLRCFSQAFEVYAGLCDAMKVAVGTWQYYLGHGLSNTAETRETFQFLANRGWLRIYILYIRDTPCAFLIGQLYNDTFYCQYAGYDPDFARFSVGWLLTARTLKELAIAGVQRVDFGEGCQEHNRRLGCQESEEATVHMYAPTLRGLWLNLFFGTTQGVRKGGRHTQSALQLGRLTKIWRQSLLSRWRSHQSSSKPQMPI